MTRALGIRLGFPIKQTLIEHLIIVSAVVSDDDVQSHYSNAIVAKQLKPALVLYCDCGCAFMYIVTYTALCKYIDANGRNDVNQHLFTWQFSNIIFCSSLCPQNVCAREHWFLGIHIIVFDSFCSKSICIPIIV